MKKRLPPFGKRLLELRKQGKVPSTGQVAIDVGWRRHVCSDREDCLALPADADPSQFDWTLVAGLPCLLVLEERFLDLADKLAQELKAAGARGICGYIRSGYCEKVGWRLWMSHFAEPRHGH